MKLGQHSPSNGGGSAWLTLRRVIFVLAGVACAVTVISYLHNSPGAGRGIQINSTSAPGDRISDPGEAGLSGSHDRLIPLAKLASEGPINPLTTGKKGQTVSVIEKETLSTALEALEQHTQAELRKRADPSIEWEDFDSAEGRRYARGRVCRVEGVLRRLEPVTNVDLSGLPVDNLYEGQIQDGHGRWYSFYCFRKPPEEISRTKKAILVGVFYKLIRYTTRRGDPLITPLIVGRTVEMHRLKATPAPPGERLLSQLPAWSLWTLGAAGLGGLTVLVWLARRRPRVREETGDVEEIDDLNIEWEGDGNSAVPENPGEER